MGQVDLTIRGAGIMGLALAVTAARRGARVRVVDPAGIGAGSSGGLVGALSPHAPDGWNAKKKFQLESLLMAPDFWADVGRIGGQDPGFAASGRVQAIMDGRELALARAREVSSATLWQGRATWQVRPATAGWCPASPSGFVIHDSLSARISPRAALAALAAALRASGAQIVVEDADAPGPVVWATGWQGLVDLGQVMGRKVGDGVKGQAILLRHALPATAPQIYHDGLHIIPHDDGTVAVGSTSEAAWTDPAPRDEDSATLLAAARAALPCLSDAPLIDAWTGIRPRATTRSPLMGEWPGRPGHFVMNGGFKIGFGMAPKMAEVMADLVLEGRDAVPEGFRLGAY